MKVSVLRIKEKKNVNNSVQENYGAKGKPIIQFHNAIFSHFWRISTQLLDSFF